MCDGRAWCSNKLDFIAAADPTPKWAGFAFNTGPMPGSVSGVYLYGRRDGERVYAVHIGETADIGRAVARLAESVGPRLDGADRFYWMAETDPGLRRQIVAALVARYRPAKLPARPEFELAAAAWDGSTLGH